MNTSFTKQVHMKIESIKEFAKDFGYSDAELNELSISYVKEEQALSLLDGDTQIQLHYAVIRIKFILKTDVDELKVNQAINHNAWFKKLRREQLQQVVAFLEAMRFGTHNRIVLRYDLNTQLFVIELVPPANSR